MRKGNILTICMGALALLSVSSSALEDRVIDDFNDGDPSPWAYYARPTGEGLSESDGAISGGGGPTPIMRRLASPINGASHDKLIIRMKNEAGSGDKALLTLIPAFKSKEFPIISDGKWHIYTIDLSNEPTWLSIQQIQLRPSLVPGKKFWIDYIRVKFTEHFQGLAGDELLFSDDFNKGIGQWEEISGIWKIQGNKGAKRLDKVVFGPSILNIKDKVFSDFVMEIKVKYAACEWPGGVYIYFRNQNVSKENMGDGYIFGYSNQAKYTWWRYRGGKGPSREIDKPGVDVVNLEDQWIWLKIVCKGNRAKFSWKAEDETSYKYITIMGGLDISEGKIGIHATGWRVLVDEVKIWSLAEQGSE